MNRLLICVINLGWRNPSKGRVRPAGVVLTDVLLYGLPQFPGSLEFIDVDLVVLYRPEESFCTCIVQYLAFAIH